MSDPNIPGNDQQGAPTPESAAAPGPQAANDAAAAPGEPEIAPSQLKEIIVVLQSDLETLKNEKIRLLADMDNLRKRGEREKGETAKYAVT
jgi:molecular chaperone GrpE (heat shock protein)